MRIAPDGMIYLHIARVGMVCLHIAPVGMTHSHIAPVVTRKDNDGAVWLQGRENCVDWCFPKRLQFVSKILADKGEGVTIGRHHINGNRSVLPEKKKMAKNI